jgi:hypothetical protein
MIKLHLGCGQKYMEGYLNIDYPPSDHTVQKSSVADEFHNLYELNYKADTIDEIRLHHVFEHFPRVDACAFLSAWNTWLKTNGRLHIEVPDFETSFKKNFSLLNRSKYEGVGLRHIFGSQEAHWAVHYEGYSHKRLEKILLLFGFEIVEVKKSNYKRTFNIEIIGRKVKSLSMNESKESAKTYLSDYLVDDSSSEMEMLKIWMDTFEKQLAISSAKG